MQEAIHAPKGSWGECAKNPVFLNEVDDSPPVYQHILPRVIARNERTVIVQGNLDSLIQSEGTKLIIQNMTWHGTTGFLKKPHKKFYVAPLGSTGIWAEERNLTYIEIELAGHMVPQNEPQAALQAFKYLLGQVESSDLLPPKDQHALADEDLSESRGLSVTMKSLLQTRGKVLRQASDAFVPSV